MYTLGKRKGVLKSILFSFFVFRTFRKYSIWTLSWYICNNVGHHNNLIEHYCENFHTGDKYMDKIILNFSGITMKKLHKIWPNYFFNNRLKTYIQYILLISHIFNNWTKTIYENALHQYRAAKNCIRISDNASIDTIWTRTKHGAYSVNETSLRLNIGLLLLHVSAVTEAIEWK